MLGRGHEVRPVERVGSRDILSRVSVGCCRAASQQLCEWSGVEWAPLKADDRRHDGLLGWARTDRLERNPTWASRLSGGFDTTVLTRGQFFKHKFSAFCVEKSSL